MSHPVFKKKLLASCVAAACSASMSMVAHAQEGGDIEELVVRGIRGSLEQSADIKRESVGVVDAISAEDIGKFPDTNLAESLQRISGVSIDRRNGEGYQITVRGFGPQFNLVTLNGRSLPTSNLNLGKSSGSNPSATRSFDMSNLAAEVVSGVEVYKTSRADISSGGIGATVNLKTRRPLDTEGFTGTVGVKALNDTTNRVGDDITPEVSAFASWSNDMFGASAALTHQERNSGESGVFTNSWSDRSGPWTDATGIQSVVDADDVRVINEPTVGQQYNMTPGIRYYHEDQERERDNAMVTLQVRPMDSLTATLDYVKAEQDQRLNGAELSFWFGGGTFPTSDVKFDGNPQVASPVYLWMENPSGAERDIGLTQNYGTVSNELESTGLNVEFQATDNLTITLDTHHSESSSLPGEGDVIGSYFNIAVGAQGNNAQGYDNSGDLPLLVGNFIDRTDGGNNGNGSGLDVGDLGSTVRQGWFSRTWGEIDQTRVDGKLELSDALTIDFGVENRELEAIQKGSFLQETLEGNWGVGMPGDIPASMVEQLDFAGLFDGYSTTLSPQSRAFFDASGIDDGSPSGADAEVFTTGWIAKDVKALGKYISEKSGLPWAPNPSDSTNRTITEEVTSFYVQGTYELDLGGMDLTAVAGVRHEATDVESRGQVAAIGITWQGDNDFVTTAGNASDAPVQIGEGDYDHTLPSLSLSVAISEDLVGRFGYSKTISRPSYNNQLEGIGAVQPPQGGPTILGAAPGTATNGNPNLKPLESENYDLSLEWYYGDASYVSIGYFKKDVPNFVGNDVEDQVVPTTFDPTNGPRAQDALDELDALGLPHTQQNVFQMVAALSDEGDGCTTTFTGAEDATNSAHCGAAFDDPGFGYQGTDGWEDNVDITANAGDPNYTARVNFPVDTQAAELDGWEAAVQHFFGDTGFGVQANYTIVNGDIGYDITSDPTTTQFALTGLSDSANLVLIYENDTWSTRLAYNWRDEFLVTTTDSANEPRFTEDYAQLDLNVGYNITDNLAVSFEGINLTGEDKRDHARTERQLLQLTIQDVRYALGVRYTFE